MVAWTGPSQSSVVHRGERKLRTLLLFRNPEVGCTIGGASWWYVVISERIPTNWVTNTFHSLSAIDHDRSSSCLVPGRGVGRWLALPSFTQMSRRGQRSRYRDDDENDWERPKRVNGDSSSSLNSTTMSRELEDLMRTI